MTFIEFLKIKKGLSVEGRAAAEFMADYYDEYAAYLANLKDGCGPDKAPDGPGGAGSNSGGAGGAGSNPDRSGTGGGD